MDTDMKKKDQLRLFEIAQTNITALDAQWMGLKRAWEQDDEQYNNEIQEKNYIGASDLKVPATYDAIETLVGYAMKVLYSRGLPVKSRPPEGGDAEKVKLFNRAMEIRMNMMEPVFRQRLNLGYRRFQKNGLCVVKVPYNADLRGADFIPLRPDEVLFDPFVASLQDIDFFCHKVRRTKKQITKMYGSVKFDELMDDRKKTSNSDDMYKHTKTMLKLGGQNIPTSVDYWTVYECWVLAKSDEKAKDETWHLVAVLEGKKLLKAKPAPYRPPFLIQGLIHQEGTVIGRSQPSAIRDHQIALNDYCNQTMDCGTVALQPMMTLDELTNADLRQLKFRPFGIIPLQGSPDSMKPIQMNLRPDIGLRMQQENERQIQRLTGATPSLIDASSKDVVATESRRALDAATTRALEHMRLFVDNILIPWHKRDLEYQKKFVSYEDFMRLVGKEAAQLGEAQLKKFFDERYDSIAEGFMDITDKVTKLQLKQNYLKLLQAMPAYADLPSFARDYGEDLGLDNPDKYLHIPTPPSLVHPADENSLMLQGVKVDVHPQDPDILHIKAHRGAEMPDDEVERAAVLELMDEHIKAHEKQHAMKSSQMRGGPLQEMPQPGSAAFQTRTQGLQPGGQDGAELVGEAMRIPPTV